jgi:hypothetical protein
MISDIGGLAEGASLADSIVGRAAALLCVYSKIVAVYGVNMSKGALSILRQIASSTNMEPWLRGYLIVRRMMSALSTRLSSE